MLKLACNALGELGTFLDSKGRKIEWKFTTSFHEEQSQFGLQLVNSLSGKQIQYVHNKMNAKIVPQTFSSSVADTNEFIMLPGHPFFQNAEATVHFMRTIDRRFDLLNVKNSYDKCFKQPMKLYNQIIWSKLIDNSVEHLPTLTTIDDTTLILHRRKHFIVGFIKVALSTKMLALELM